MLAQISFASFQINFLNERWMDELSEETDRNTFNYMHVYTNNCMCDYTAL